MSTCFIVPNLNVYILSLLCIAKHFFNGYPFMELITVLKNL